VNPVARPQPRSASRIDGIEFVILAWNQLISQRETRHRLESSDPGAKIGSVGVVEAAFGHEDHAASASNIGDSAIIVDDEWLILD
jgi:hypothetical protein